MPERRLAIVGIDGEPRPEDEVTEILEDVVITPHAAYYSEQAIAF